MFLKILTAGDKYPLPSRDNLMQQVEVHLSQKQKTCSQIFCAFLKPALNFEHFKKKVTLKPYVFPKLRIPKDVVR